MLAAIDETVQVVRKISTELRPGLLDDAGMFGGEVEIGGIPGKGTTVIVRIPIDGPAHENTDR